MLYQKDPRYAHLPHSEWLKTPDGERYRQALAQYGAASEGRDLSPSRPEDRIRDLMGRPGRRPVSHGKGPPPGKPPKPEPPKGNCYSGCYPDGTPMPDKRCRQKPDPNCKNDFPGGKGPAGPYPYDPTDWRPILRDKTKPGWSAGMTQYQR